MSISPMIFLQDFHPKQFTTQANSSPGNVSAIEFKKKYPNRLSFNPNFEDIKIENGHANVL